MPSICSLPIVLKPKSYSGCISYWQEGVAPHVDQFVEHATAQVEYIGQLGLLLRMLRRPPPGKEEIFVQSLDALYEPGKQLEATTQ